MKYRFTGDPRLYHTVDQAVVAPPPVTNFVSIDEIDATYTNYTDYATINLSVHASAAGYDLSHCQLDLSVNGAYAGAWPGSAFYNGVYGGGINTNIADEYDIVVCITPDGTNIVPTIGAGLASGSAVAIPSTPPAIITRLQAWYNEHAIWVRASVTAPDLDLTQYQIEVQVNDVLEITTSDFSNGHYDTGNFSPAEFYGSEDGWTPVPYNVVATLTPIGGGAALATASALALDARV